MSNEKYEKLIAEFNATSQVSESPFLQGYRRLAANAIKNYWPAWLTLHLNEDPVKIKFFKISKEYRDQVLSITNEFNDSEGFEVITYIEESTGKYERVSLSFNLQPGDEALFDKFVDKFCKAQKKKIEVPNEPEELLDFYFKNPDAIFGIDNIQKQIKDHISDVCSLHFIGLLFLRLEVKFDSDELWQTLVQLGENLWEGQPMLGCNPMAPTETRLHRRSHPVSAYSSINKSFKDINAFLLLFKDYLIPAFRKKLTPEQAKMEAEFLARLPQSENDIDVGQEAIEEIPLELSNRFSALMQDDEQESNEKKKNRLKF